MKRKFLILLSAIFALSAISLVIVQVFQTKTTLSMSDNLFNISVNNALENVITQIDQMKVEDYVTKEERYKVIQARRIDELNDKIIDIVKSNSDLFYDEQRINFGIAMQDSAYALPKAKLNNNEESVVTQYNTLLNARKRLVNKSNSKESSSYRGTFIDASNFKYEVLDSLIKEELIINGVDLLPTIGVIDMTKDSLIFCSSTDSTGLASTPYRYGFHPNGINSNDNFFILLAFSPTSILLKQDSTIFISMSLFLILIIIGLFLFSMRTIVNQRKLDEMKTDFINNMTHEIKTPIATIGLACEMLKEDGIASDLKSQRNFVNIINDENRRMRMLIETILQNAKMSNKNFSINCKEINIQQIIEEAVRTFNLTIENRKGSIEVAIQPISGTLYADELHITNMMHNLVDNAIKYSTENPQIAIKVNQQTDNLIIKVSDNGIGITKEDQKHIFEKFYRVSTGNVHNVKGFGIGLNYVSQVVALHHGKISVESELGEGTTFIIELPLN